MARKNELSKDLDEANQSINQLEVAAKTDKHEEDPKKNSAILKTSADGDNQENER